MKRGALFRRCLRALAFTRACGMPACADCACGRWSRRFFVLNNHVLFVYADDSHSSGPAARPLSVRRLSCVRMRFLTRAVFFSCGRCWFARTSRGWTDHKSFEMRG